MLGLPFLRESTTEPNLQTTIDDSDSLDTPTARNSASDVNLAGLPEGEPYKGGEDEGETIARTTTNSSSFSTLSSNSGGIEKGSKREREWRDHFELQDEEEEMEELVESEYKEVTSVVGKLSSSRSFLTSSFSSLRMCSRQRYPGTRENLHLDVLGWVQS